MRLPEKKALAVDHLSSSVATLAPDRRAELFRAFAALMAYDDIAALLFSWADELDASAARNEQLRLDFMERLESSNGEDLEQKNGKTDGVPPQEEV